VFDAVEEEEEEESPVRVGRTLRDIPVEEEDDEEEETTDGVTRTDAGALVLLESHNKCPPYAAPITPIPAAVLSKTTAIATLVSTDN